MKLCDRCYKLGEYRLGVREIITSTHENYDLCVSCFDNLIDFINKTSEEKTTGTKRGRRPSKKTEA